MVLVVNNPLSKTIAMGLTIATTGDANEFGDFVEKVEKILFFTNNEVFTCGGIVKIQK